MCNRQVALRHYYTLQDEIRPASDNQISIISSQEIVSFETKRADVSVQTSAVELNNEHVQTDFDSICRGFTNF